MPRAVGDGQEAGPSRPRGGEGSGAGPLAGKTRRTEPGPDGVRRKKKRPPGNSATPTLQSNLLAANTPERRDRIANINPALRPYLATAPKPVSSLTRSALDEAVPLRQSPRQETVGAVAAAGSGLILPSAFLRSRSSLNLSINESSGLQGANAAAGPSGRTGSGVNGGGEGSEVALAPPINLSQPAARMYAAGLVAPPMIVGAGSAAAMLQAQAQAQAQAQNNAGRRGSAPITQPQQGGTPERGARSGAGPSRRRERTGGANRTDRTADGGRRRSTEDLRSRQHPNISSTSLTLLPGSSTLMRIPEDGTADAGPPAVQNSDQDGGTGAANGRRRRTRANEQLRRRPTVSSREEGRALGLSRGASMRRVNVWDEVRTADQEEVEMEEPPPPFPFPPASGASPTARAGAGAAGQPGGLASTTESHGETGAGGASAAEEGPPPAFVAGPSRAGASTEGPASVNGNQTAGPIPSSPPPTFAQAMGLEPLPHSLPPLASTTIARTQSVRSQTARSVRSGTSHRAPSPSPTVYESAPSSPVQSDYEDEDGGHGANAGLRSGSDTDSTGTTSAAQVAPERAAWEEDVRAGLGLDERVRREYSRKRRRGELNVARRRSRRSSGSSGSSGPSQGSDREGAAALNEALETVNAGEAEDGELEPRGGGNTPATEAARDIPVSGGLQAEERVEHVERDSPPPPASAAPPVTADEDVTSPTEQPAPPTQPEAVSERSMSLMIEPASSPTTNRDASATATSPDVPISAPAAVALDEGVISAPARKLTRGKAIRRSSSGYGSLSLSASGPASPEPEQGASTSASMASPRLILSSRRRSQQQNMAHPPASPSLSESTDVGVQASPRLPLFGDTGFDWRPAGHLSRETLAEEEHQAGGCPTVEAATSVGITRPALSPPLASTRDANSKNARTVQRSSVDFAAVGPGRRVGDETTAPALAPTLDAAADAVNRKSSPTTSQASSKTLASGSRFHEMPRRSTESDVLPHRQAALKRRELYTATASADALPNLGGAGPFISPALATSPTSPARRRLEVPLPSGPLVDFSDYDFYASAGTPSMQETGGMKGKARADSMTSSTSTSTSTAHGSHRSRPLMPLPPELVALFHDDIPEELEEDEGGEDVEEAVETGPEEEEEAEEDKQAVETEASREKLIDGTDGEAPELGVAGQITPNGRPASTHSGSTLSRNQPTPTQETTRHPPALSIYTDKLLPALPPLPARPAAPSPSGETGPSNPDESARKRAPPPPPSLKRHLVSTTVGANLAPRRSIIRTADTPVTPRPMRQFGTGGIGQAHGQSMRRPPPPPPRPVSQQLQDALSLGSLTSGTGLARNPSWTQDARYSGPAARPSTSDRPPASAAIERDAPVVPPRPVIEGVVPDAGHPPPPVQIDAPPPSQSSYEAIKASYPQAVSSTSAPAPPALPPRPWQSRPLYERNDSIVSSSDSVLSDPTTLSRLAPLPVYKPPPALRPRGPRPKPPPVPARPCTQIITDEVSLPHNVSAASGESTRPAADRSHSDNSVRTTPGRPLDSPSSMSTVRGPTRRSASEMDLRGVASGGDTVNTTSPRSPWSPRVPVGRHQSMEYTDLDLLVSRLEGSGREYEGFTQISAFLGPGKTPAATPGAIATLLPGLVSVDSRRVTKDGKIKLKLSLLGVRVAKCPICLAQFKKDERGVILPECGHHAHESCARKWFKEDGRCFVCREPLAEEGGSGEGAGRAGGSRMVEGVV